MSLGRKNKVEREKNKSKFEGQKKLRERDRWPLIEEKKKNLIFKEMCRWEYFLEEEKLTKDYRDSNI